jgi:hypothetical protein
VIPVGGLRARYLHDSLQAAIRDGLDQLGWFDPGRSHRPVVFLPEPVDWDSEIRQNTLVVTTRTRQTRPHEVGSNLSRDLVAVGVDVYGESEALASHLTNDIRDLLRGRLPVGPQRGALPILDFMMATPVPIGSAVIADVRASRLAPQGSRAYTSFWFGIEAELFDTYYDASET